MSEANTPLFLPLLARHCLYPQLSFNTTCFIGYSPPQWIYGGYHGPTQLCPPPPSFFLQTTVGNAEVKPLEEHVHAVRLLSAWLYQKYIYRVSSTRWLEWLL